MYIARLTFLNVLCILICLEFNKTVAPTPTAVIAAANINNFLPIISSEIKISKSIMGKYRFVYSRKIKLWAR